MSPFGFKGMIFSIEALFAFGIVMTALLLLLTSPTLQYVTFPYGEYHQVANDIMQVLEKSGKLDRIGTLWVLGNCTVPQDNPNCELAYNLSRESIEPLLPSNLRYRFSFDSTPIVNATPGDTIIKASRVLSGYKVGEFLRGYVARAWATRLRKNTTTIIPMLPQGSGWNARRLEVTKKFLLPSNITIYNATLWVSIHLGTTEAAAEFQSLKVNGVQVKDEIVWLYKEEIVIGREITTAAFGYVGVAEHLQEGENEIYLVIGSPVYHSHVHPGMRLVVLHSLSQSLVEARQNLTLRYYFDDVLALGSKDGGAWAIQSFHIPRGARVENAILHMLATELEDTGWKWIPWIGWTTADYLIFINSYLISGDPVDGVVNLTLDIKNYLVNGTNVISAYFNCYGDYAWGEKRTTIYSDPIDDPDGSSWVEISYSLASPPFAYGEIDITKEILFGGEVENPKEFQFNLSHRESSLLSAFVHVAQGFSAMLEVNATHGEEEPTNVFRSPAIRAVPENVYLYPEIFGVGENYIWMRDFQPDGSTSVLNKILPWSSLEYTYLVKAIVGYGRTFATESEAIQDAIFRLNQSLGAEIAATQIQTGVSAIPEIPYLWGPSIFTLEVWE
jgi:hypothetical protein